MAGFQCPNCGASLELGPDDRVAVCQNCNTCVTNDRTVVKEHYLLPAHYSASEAVERLILWLKKQTGTDEELPVSIEISSSNLSFFPFWNIQVKAATSYTGAGPDAVYSGRDSFFAEEYRHVQKVWKPETGSFDRIFSFTYPAVAEVPPQLLSYEFPTRAKKYFGQSYATEFGGRVLNGRLSQQDAETRARQDTFSSMTSLIMREVDRIDSRNEQIDISSSYYLHVPVWDISYRFGKKDYRAFVDASTGRVIFATYPVSLEYRVGMGAASVGHVAVGTLLLLAAASLFSGALFALGVGLGSIGLALAWVTFGQGQARETTK